jgi:hypothetical protein
MLKRGRNQDRKEGTEGNLAAKAKQAKVQCDLPSSPHYAIHTVPSDSSFVILLPVVSDWKVAHRSVNMGHLWVNGGEAV